MKILIHVTFGVLFCLTLTSCTVKVTPPLNTSLRMEAFEKMKKIDMRDVRVALYIDPKVKQLRIDQNLKAGEFSFEIGKSFSAKLIKALSYNFRTIYLLDTLQENLTEPIDAIMKVDLQDIDSNLDLSTGFSKVSIESYMRLSIRSEIVDSEEKKTIWVGTSQAKETGKHEDIGLMTYQEAGRGMATAMDSVVDKAVGDLVDQMRRSENLRKYIVKWEKKNTGGI